MALLDFSKAYDMVWRQRLFHILLSKGIPHAIVRWLSGFLCNRQARVLVNGSLGRCGVIRQGLPQGSVLAPLLFLFFIDEVASGLPPDVNISLYADDVTLWSSHHVKESALASLQRAVSHVGEWSRRAKLLLSSAKSELTFFSAGSHDAAWSPTVDLMGQPLPFNPTPKLLGVTLDRRLSFKPHTDAICHKSLSRSRMLSALVGKDWGWRKQNLRNIFKAMHLSILCYASSAWHPWLASSHFETLERTQSKLLRIITGQLQSSPVEAVRLESGVVSLATHSLRLSAGMWERCLRLPAGHPLRALCDRPCRARLKRGCWRSLASSFAGSLPASFSRRLPMPLLPDPAP
jgi:hypothetical protein